MRTVAETPTFLTRDELARTLHVSMDAVRCLLRHRTHPLPHIRAGRRYLFTLEEVIAHLKRMPPPSYRRVRKVGSDA